MDNKRWLKKNLIEKRTLNKNKKIKKKKKMEKRKKQVVEFQKLLLILMHLTGD